MNQQQTLDLLADALRDKYEILRWLGGGGMAEVYLARHRIHGALFAVKVLAHDLSQDERIVARFVQEARTAATLSGHPNIVTIFDIGAANGLYYLIMQYVEGDDLAQYLKRHEKLSCLDAAKIIAQVAEALVWAAEKGVVHRDLKPSNLYLDANGRIIVLDFGIAKAGDIPSMLTAATERLGTSYYMSPEQIRGERCDQRSDLYSLGVVFYELLAGCKPFEGDSYRAIETAHIEKVPVDVREICPDIPVELCGILARMLAKEAARRYQTPGELLEDLNRFGATSSPLTGRARTTRANEALRLNANAGPGADYLSATEVQTPSYRTAALQTPSNRTPVPAEGSAPESAPPSPQRDLLSRKVLLSGIAVFILVIGTLLYFLLKPTTAKSPTPPPVTPSLAQQQLSPTFTDKSGNRMLLVPGGAFIFGNDTDHLSPNGQETAELGNYYMDEMEVSNRQYLQFCHETHRKPPAESPANAPESLPVTGVSLEDAQAYAKWAGKRLPTEKEWEKAARGPKGNLYPWGNDNWNRGINGPPTAPQPVSSYAGRRSPYGMYNLAGNVFEWTDTHYPTGEAEINDMAKTLRTHSFSRDWKVIKGGCFGQNPKLDVFWKAYMRRGWPKDVGSPLIGFRCVKDAP